jgi:hypothetical protein
VLGSERLTGALLDRLTHHVHILEMNGESYRLKESKQKRPQKLASRRDQTEPSQQGCQPIINPPVTRLRKLPPIVSVISAFVNARYTAPETVSACYSGAPGLWRELGRGLSPYLPAPALCMIPLGATIPFQHVRIVPSLGTVPASGNSPSNDPHQEAYLSFLIFI